jgi:Polyketide cyclase / dehydrase and lipid transport
MSASLRDQFERGVMCRHAVRLGADADAVWRLIGDIGSVAIAEGFIERIDVTGSGAGAVRTLHLRDGSIVRERIEEYSAADRYYVYRGLDPGPFDFTHYLAMASVVTAGPGQCILSWTTTATAVDGKDAEIRALLDGNILSVFAATRRYLDLAAD